MKERGETPDIFHLSLEFRTGAAHEPGHRLNLQRHKLFDSDYHDDERSALAIWGTPALNDKLLTAHQLAQRIYLEGIDAVASRLDCGFLIVFYDKLSDQLAIITDRTGSLPLFYTFRNDHFAASSSFKRLFDQRGAGASAGLDPWTIAEFFYFRRVFGTHTYDRNISYLPYASVLTVDGNGKMQQRKYWKLRAEKLQLSHDVLAERLADRKSVV